MSNKLVAYFTTGGRTGRLAETLAKAISADIYEIKAADPYTEKDLDWADPASRTTQEGEDPKARPALADRDAAAEKYDVLLVGFPVWWYTAPRIINTFLESYDLSGKTILLFATSGGGDMGNAEADLKASLPADVRIMSFNVTGKETDEEVAARISAVVGSGCGCGCGKIEGEESAPDTPAEEEKIVQTAGRDQLGCFAPLFAHLNDDVLFGEVWNDKTLNLKTRCIITVTALIASGITDSSLEYHIRNAKAHGVTADEMAALITHTAMYAGWPKAWAAMRIAKAVYSE